MLSQLAEQGVLALLALAGLILVIKQLHHAEKILIVSVDRLVERADKLIQLLEEPKK